MFRTRSAAIVSMTLGTGLVVGLAAGVLTHHLTGAAYASAQRHPATAARGDLPQPCSASTAVLGYIGVLAPGHHATDVPTGAIRATTLASAGTSQVLLPPRPQTQTGLGPAAVPPVWASSALRASGVVYAQSARPDLRSCNYMLSDRPADRPLVNAAERTLISHGELAPGAATRIISLFVSDNPLNHSQSIVTVVVRGTKGHAAAGARPGTVIYPSSAYAVVESTSTGQASAWGHAPW